jgi:hypothetical protein
LESGSKIRVFLRPAKGFAAQAVKSPAIVTP